MPITIDLTGKEKKRVVSAKQAKKIAVSKRAGVVAAIPPNIDDITAVLREQKPDAKKIAQLTKLADKKPPKTKSASKLSQFYHDRGIAAGDVGRTEQEMSDFKLAVKYAEAARNTQLKYFAYGRLASAAGGTGLFQEAVKYRKKTVQSASRASQKIRQSAILATTYASLGHLAEADKTMKQVQALLRKGMSKKEWQRWGMDLSRSVKNAQATVFSSKGEHAKATVLYKSALSDYAKHLQQSGNKKSKAYGDIISQVLRRRLSKSLEKEGKIVEAELVVRTSLLDRLKDTGLYSTWAPRVILRFADHLSVQGRFDESQQLINIAIDVMNQLGFEEKSYRVLSAQMQMARLELLSGNTNKAVELYGKVAKSSADASDYAKRIIESDIDRLLAFAIGGQHEGVIAHFAKYGAEKSGAAFVRGAYRLGAKAIALAKSGETEKSLKQFRELVPLLTEKKEQQSDEDYTQGSSGELRNTIVLEEYLKLLAELKGTPNEATFGINAAAEAFKIADAARGQLVQKAVSAASARASVDNKELAELVRTEQDTRKRLTAQSGLLATILASPSNQQDRKAVKNLESNIANLQKALDRLVLDIKKKFPEYASLLNPASPEVADIQKALYEGESYISIYVGRDRSYVWALPKKGELAFHVSDLTAKRTAQFVQALRDALNPAIETLGDIPDFDVRVGYRLYEKLLKPVEAGWKDAKSLLVTTNGALGQLPLGVLPTERKNIATEGALFQGYRDVKWLARTHAITTLPSASTLTTLRKLPVGDDKRQPFIGFGNPFFNKEQANRKIEVAAAPTDALASRGVLKTRGLPIRLRAAPRLRDAEQPDLSNLPALPDTGDEVRGIALAMAADVSSAIQLGVKASEDTIRETDLSKFKVIAFATHGLIPGDLSGLREPALALTAPEIAKSKGDGLLTMSEIMGLKLDADWVVLSACNTGTGRGAGAEAVSGLGRAFFYAGTRSLLVSSWPVETVSARLLTTDIFERLTKNSSLSRAEALQQAISNLIDRPAQMDADTGNPLFYYAHPIFWAPFILVGDGGKITS